MRRNPWNVWIVVTVTSFAVLEGHALRSRRIPTLSENLARWSGVYPRTRRGRVTPIVFMGFWTWLTVHVCQWQGAK